LISPKRHHQIDDTLWTNTFISDGMQLHLGKKIFGARAVLGQGLSESDKIRMRLRQSLSLGD